MSGGLPDNLRHLRLFLALSGKGSLSAAAAQMGLSQPAASQALAALERRAGGPLFARRMGGALTPRGLALQPRVVRAFARGRESYYELAEPLMRWCMEVKQQRGEALAKFIVLLRERYAQTDAAPWPRPPNDAAVLALAYEERKLLEPMASVFTPHEMKPQHAH